MTEGRYTGEIVSDGTLNVGKDAQVQGTLDVGELLLSGRFNGEVTAKRRVVVYNTGVLEGQVTTPNLLTEEGGIIEGQICMKAPTKPKSKSLPLALHPAGSLPPGCAGHICLMLENGA